MSVEKNKAMVRRVIEEAVNKGNLAVIDDIMAPNYVYHFPGMEVKGPEGFRQFATMMRTAFPDLNASIDEIIGEGNLVAARVTLRGTLKGAFMGMAPTGRKMEFPEAVFVYFEGGKEVEAWPYADTQNMFKQLGLKPPA
ncbi:MAG TPA: ester cyclase [Dehalococcoidales bacterium]|nr:ester cyclase [Dehalococcoidales bacterium]